MNFDGIYKNYFKISKNKKINYELIEELKQEKISKLKATYKTYLLEFFLNLK